MRFSRHLAVFAGLTLFAAALLGSISITSATAAPQATPAPPQEEKADAPSSGGWISRADGTQIKVGGAVDLPAHPPPAGVPAVEPGREIEQRIFELTNDARRRHGREPLHPDETLTELARLHSADMLRRGFFSHVNPDGEAPADRVAVHHRRLVGESSENVWKGSGNLTDDPAILAERIVEGWMRSAGHRANLLREGSTHLGVGVVRAEGEVRATQNFAAVWAWLDRPVPYRVSRDALPELRMTPFGAHGPATHFDALRPGSRERDGDPIPLAARRLAVAPGTYRLRFYFPKQAGAPGRPGFWIVEGPEIVVR